MAMCIRASMARSVFVVALLTALAPPALAFDLQGHRCARSLAPENTLHAFARALSIGVTTIELDLSIAKDGAVVVSHDRRLNPDITRLSTGEWLSAPGPTIMSLTLEEIQRFDVGQIKPGTAYAKLFPDQQLYKRAWIPTLAEVVALTRKAGNEEVRFNIETKLSPLAAEDTVDPEAFARSVIAEVGRLGISERVSIQSFDWRTLASVARIAPNVPLVFLTLERGQNDNIWKGRGAVSPWTGLDAAAYDNRTARIVHAAGGKIWSPLFRDIDSDAIREAKSLGLAVVVWTVNEKADMARLIELGVDGIITDRPDRLREVLAEKGMPLPRSTPIAAGQ